MPHNGWKRRGYFYEAKVKFETDNPWLLKVRTRRLGFVTYHLIRLIHGDERLREMAYGD